MHIYDIILYVCIYNFKYYSIFLNTFYIHVKKACLGMK